MVEQGGTLGDKIHIKGPTTGRRGPEVLLLCVLFSGALSASAGRATAQEEEEEQEEDGAFWDPEVVTPTGQPTRISETPSATFIITGEEIRRSGAESLPEVLRRVPGLEVRQLAASDGQVSARGFVLELSNRIQVSRPLLMTWLG